jgi:hypothetical protein
MNPKTPCAPLPPVKSEPNTPGAYFIEILMTVLLVSFEFTIIGGTLAILLYHLLR